MSVNMELGRGCHSTSQKSMDNLSLNEVVSDRFFRLFASLKLKKIVLGISVGISVGLERHYQIYLCLQVAAPEPQVAVRPDSFDEIIDAREGPWVFEERGVQVGLVSRNVGTSEIRYCCLERRR